MKSSILSRLSLLLVLFTMALQPLAAQEKDVPTHGQAYRIYNRQYSTRLLTDNGEKAVFPTEKVSRDLSQMWMVLGDDTKGYLLKNIATGRYISASNSLGTEAKRWFFPSKTGTDGVRYHGIAPSLTPSGNVCFNLNGNGGNYTLASWRWSATADSEVGSDWRFEMIEYGQDGEYTIGELTTLVRNLDPHSTLQDGNIYRIENRVNPGYFMTENFTSGKVFGRTTEEVDNPASQLWMVMRTGTEAGTDGKFLLQNVLTGHYIKSQPTTSAQYSTCTTTSQARSFVAQNHDGSDFQAPDYTFGESKDGPGLHFAPHQQYGVVRWTVNADASHWYIQEVTLTAEEKAEIALQRKEIQANLAAFEQLNANTAAFTTQLATFFEDAACTRLKSSYAKMSDANLRTAMAALPETIQDMAVKVKNDSWGLQAYGKSYEKLFRITDYQAYSKHNYWGNMEAIGTCHAFSRLSNPTGIHLQTGETVCLYVDQDATTGCTLQLEAVDHVKTEMPTTGTVKDLHAGLNVYMAPCEQYLFIFYEITDTSRKLADVPQIKIHIEGGDVQGVFDTTRGMDNADWKAMQELDLFHNFYLHMKNRYLVFNVEAGLVLPSCPNDAVGVLGKWEKMLDLDYQMLGIEEYRDRWNNVLNVRSYRNPAYDYAVAYATTYGTSYQYYSMPGNLSETDIDLWGPAHENGHIMQTPINMIGMTECSNNLFSNIAMWEVCNATSRADGPQTCLDNYNRGTFWTDMGTWQCLRPYWQLYLYFHVLGNDPQFYPHLYQSLRKDPLQRFGGSRTTWADRDYLKFYRACCDAAQADLTEFFEAWGFFRIPEFTSYTDDKGTVYGGVAPTDSPSLTDGERRLLYPEDTNGSSYGKHADGGNIYVDQTMIDEAKAYVASKHYRKLSNILFIDDRGLTAAESGRKPTDEAKYVPGSNVNVGDVRTYAKPAKADGYCYTSSYNEDGTANITMRGRCGAVGYKLYDDAGHLLWLSVVNDFKVSTEVASLLKEGRVRVVVAQTDLTDVEVAEGEAPMIVYAIYTDARGALTVKSESDTRLWGTSEGGVNQTVDGTNPLQQFAFIEKDGKTYLYSIATGKYVSATNLGTLTTEPTDPIYKVDEGGGTVRLRFSETMNINLGGSKQVTIDGWTTKDAGNSFHIVKVDEIFRPANYDLNHDGKVDSKDVTCLTEMTLGLRPIDKQGDFNHDGRLTVEDITTLILQMK